MVKVKNGAVNFIWYHILLASVIDSSSHNATGACAPDGIEYGTKCIWAKNRGVGLNGSQSDCQQFGGNLATFRNMSEINDMLLLTKLVDTYVPVVDVYVGVTQVKVNGSYTYYWLNTNVEPFFARWRNISTSDKGSCLALTGDDFKTLSCTSWISYVCERDLSIPVPTTIVRTQSAHASTPAGCGGITSTPMCATGSPTLASTNGTSSVSTPPGSTITSSSTNSSSTLTAGHPSTFQSTAKGAHSAIDEIVSSMTNTQVSNMSSTEVKVLVSQVTRLVTTVTTQTEVRHMTVAMVKLSTMTSCDETTFKMFASSMSTVMSLVKLVPGDTEINSEEQPENLLAAMENVMFATNITSTVEIYQSFTLSIQTFNGNESSVVLTYDREEVIQLSPGVFAGGAGGRVTTVVYNSLHEKISGRNRKYRRVKLISKVISVAVQDADDTRKSKVDTPNAITFTVKHDNEKNITEKSRICAFWDESVSEWSDTGCRLLHKNSSHTTCTCDHLTSFAVLVMYYDPDEVSSVRGRAMQILSAVGCSLSILGLAMTIFTFVYLRMFRRDRIMIHTNLAVSLMLAQIIFVSSDEAYRNEVLCKAVAILMHFFFMAAFTWMMLEGLCLYLSCHGDQHNYGDMRLKYLVIGWGVPVLIVLLSVAVQFPHYGDGPGDSCWLSAEYGLIWAFMAPMLMIVIFNLVIIGLVLRVFLTLKANSHKTEAARVKSSLRATIMLLPLLGSTWLLSILVPYSTIFHYLFIIGNSLQGLLIFFLHCLCNQEVRKFLAAKRSNPTAAGTSDTDLSAQVRRRKPTANTFDDVQLRRTQSEPLERRNAWI